MHKIRKNVSLLCAFLVMFISFSAVLMPVLRVGADSTYSYREVTVGNSADESDQGLDICLEEFDANGDNKVLAIVEENLDDDFTYYWCEDERNTNKYIFVFNGFATGGAAGNGEGIFVNGANPDQGSRGLIGRSAITGDDAEAVTISNTQPFTNLYSGATDETSQDLADDIQVATDNTTAQAAQEELNDNSCEGSSSFGFLLCPVMYTLGYGVDKLDEFITRLLFTDVDRLESGGLKDGWNSVRNIAYIILIPVMLVMVIGTALNLNVFDAYTVKRALPRMLAAIIFISLSWDICVLMIDVVNTIGVGVPGLIGSSIREGGIAELQLKDIFGVTEGAAATAAVGFTGIVAAALTIMAVFTPAAAFLLGYFALMFLSVFLVLFIAFLLLAFREVLIVALVILSPLAIIAWIFPGNDKPWKFWWNSFSKLLLLFPIITFLITIGKAFAWMIFAAERQPETLEEYALLPAYGLLDMTLKFIAYFAPYFLIPATFKLAGSAFANISGMVNNKERGVLDRLRKARGGAGKKGVQQGMYGVKTGMVARRGGMVGRLGRRAQQASHLSSLTLADLQGGKKGIEAGLEKGIRTTGQTLGAKAIEEDADLAVATPNDSFDGSAAAVLLQDEVGLAIRLQMKNKKLSDDEAMKQAKELLQDARKDANGTFRKVLQSVEGVTGPELDVAVSQFSGARTKHDDKLLARHFVEKATAGGTYYKDGTHMERQVGLASIGDDNARATLVAKTKSAALQAGRADSSAGFGDSFNMAGTASGDVDLQEMRELAEEFTSKAYRAHSATTNFHESMKGGSTDNFIELLNSQLATAKANGDEVAEKQLTGEITQIMQQAQTYYKGEIQGKLDKAFGDIEVTVTNKEGQPERVKLREAVTPAPATKEGLEDTRSDAGGRPPEPWKRD